jgi:hypothetical protein
MYRMMIEVDGRLVRVCDYTGLAVSTTENEAEFDDSVLASLEIESRIEDAL